MSAEGAFSAALALAWELLDQGRQDEAATLARRLMDRTGVAAKRSEELAQLCGALGLTEEGPVLVGRARQLKPTSAMGGLGPPEARPDAGGKDEADRLSGELVRSSPTDVESILAEAREALRRHRPDLALDRWQAALAREPRRIEARLGRVRCLRQDGRFIEAQAACDTILAELPGDRRALIERARIAEDADDPAGAEPWWLAALGPAAEDLASRLGWAACLGRQHRFAEARAVLAALAAARPQAVEIGLVRGRLALVEGDHMTAETHLAALPPSLTARLALGRVAELRHELKAALAHYGTLVAAFPVSPDAHLAFARLALQQAELKMAADSYAEARRLDANRLEAWAGLALARHELGDEAGALSLAESAAARWPREPKALLILPQILEAAARWDAAEAALLTARSALAHRAAPLLALARLTRRRQGLEVAREHAEAALAAHGRSLEVVLLATDLRLASRDLDSARELAGSLGRRLPEHHEVQKRLARLDVLDGRMEEARRRWRRVVRHSIRIEGPSDPIQRCDGKPIPEDPDELRLFIVQRNERVRLAWLLGHYRRLGVQRFFVLDNGSDDGTLEWLLDQPDDLHLFRTDASYAAAGYGLRWTHALLDRWGEGRWCLVVDADEALVYPHWEHLPLPALTRHLDAQGAEALLAPMLDMYGKEPLSRCRYAPGESLIERFPWFDGEAYAEEEVPEFPFRRLTGGPRQRCLSTGQRLAAQMEKVPLLRWSRSIRFTSSTHQLFPVKLADETGLLLHFKHLPDFVDSVRREVERGQHSMGARRYRSYLRKLTQVPDLSFHHEGSVRYQDSAQLVRLGLMRTTPALDAQATRLAGACAA